LPGSGATRRVADESAQQGDVSERLHAAFIAGDLRGRVATALAEVGQSQAGSQPGALDLNFEAMEFPSHPGLTLLVYTAPAGTPLFELATCEELLALLDENGPDELLRQVRAAEAADPEGRRWPRTKRGDDATAVYLVLS
jgi:hypothetical protein